MISTTFDFQKVTLTPFGQTSSLYYSKRLGNYNSIITETNNMATSWYIWSEPKCNKSSCKIATALQNYLTKENKESIEHVYSFSNTSGAQNNNHMVFQIILNIFHNFNVNSIILTYLVSGNFLVSFNYMVL